MDINEEADNIHYSKTLNDEAEAEARLEMDILQSKIKGIREAYLKAIKMQRWELAHNLLYELIRTHEMIRRHYDLIEGCKHYFPSLVITIREGLQYPRTGNNAR